MITLAGVTKFLLKAQNRIFCWLGFSPSTIERIELRWGPAIHRSGLQSNTDLEPGRCRRTDGKKWRCGRDVVPDQKYCEKHVHRGRQRPPGSTNVGPIRTSSTTSGGGTSGSSCFSLSSCLQQQQQRPSSHLSVKRYFSSTHSSPSPGSGGGSLSAASSQFDQLPSLTSSPSTAAAASTFASKDYRKYLVVSSVMKSDQQPGIGSEQQHLILPSKTLGSTARGQGHETSQMLSNLSRLESVNQSRHCLLSSKVSAAPHESKVNSNSCSSGLLHFGHSTSSPQLTRGQLLGSIDEPDQEQSNSDINLSNHVATPSINNTQFSISIPITAASSAHEHPGSPTAGILYLSCFLYVFLLAFSIPDILCNITIHISHVSRKGKT
ncbi:unnamed protein product [Sphagnum tenellum]